MNHAHLGRYALLQKDRVQPFLEGTGPEETTEGANTASDTARTLRNDSF